MAFSSVGADRTSAASIARFRVACWLAWLAMLAGGAELRAEVVPEYRVKASFLYNFTRFVTWPPECFADSAEPIRIVVLGKNPFGNELESIVQERRVGGRAVSVFFLPSLRDEQTSAVPGHVLFVPAGEEAAFEQLAPALEAAGTLTVGESARFRAQGGMVIFTTAKDRVQFEINVAAVERAGLKVSAQLQKLALRGRKKN